MELCETFFILTQLYDITVWSRTIMRVENMKILLGVQSTMCFEFEIVFEIVFGNCSL